MKKIFLIMFFIITTCGTAAASGQTYYVQSMKAKVMSETSFKSKVVGEVGKGHKFSSTEKTGNWIKVNYAGRTGYVSRLLVSTYPPMQKAGLINARGEDINQGARRRASTYTSAAAARGLAADDRRRLAAEEKADYTSLDKIEAFSVSDDEVTRFQERAGL